MHQAEEDLEMQEVASGLSSDEESKDERLPRSISHQISTDDEGDDYLSDDAQNQLLLPCDGLLESISEQGYNIGWRDLSYTAQARRLTKEPPFIVFRKGTAKKLLDNLEGFAAAGRLLAIMGPSGCGKTTFLDLLAGRVSSGVVEGQIAVNGQPKSKRTKRLMAYVMQEDTLIGDLSVRSNLYYSALLRLPRSMPLKEKKKKVEQVIEELGLSDCANTIVGTPLRRGISGGQRRRVSIGMELITDPSILLLDEPTSGLDSKSAASVVEILLKLARDRNRTIICTIHSPSSHIFQMFDDLMLLSRGKLIFCGPREGALLFFSKQGMKVPQHTNPADHFLDLINYDFSGSGEIPHHVQKLVDNFPNSKAAQCNRKRIDRTGEEAFIERTRQLAKSLKGKYANGTWYQTLVLMRRTFVVFLKNPAIYWARIAMYFMLALMMGTLFFQISDKQDSIQDRISVLFFSVAFLTFMSIAAVPAFIEDKLLFVRERMNGAYRVSAYAMAQTLISIPFIVAIALIFSGTAYFLVGLKSSGFGHFLLDLSLALMVAEAMVVTVSALVPHLIIGLAVGAGFYGMFMLACGFFVKASNIPGWWIWLHYISFHKYAFEIFMYNEFKGQTYPCSPMGNGTYFCAYPNVSDHPSYLTGEQILANYDYEEVVMWRWYLVLIAMLLFLRLSFYVVLRFLNRGKR